MRIKTPPWIRDNISPTEWKFREAMILLREHRILNKAEAKKAFLRIMESKEIIPSDASLKRITGKIT